MSRSKQLHLLLASLFFWLCAPSFAGVPMAPIKLKVENQDRVFIKGYRGKVEYITRDNLADLTVTVREVEKATSTKKSHLFGSGSDDWQVSVKKENATILVVVEGPANKQSWGELLVAGTMTEAVPEFIVSLVGPARPVEVSWYEGPIKIENLGADLRVTSIKSSIDILQGHGDTTVSLQEGDLEVKQRKGSVHIESYNAKINLTGSDGPVHIENFSGDTRLQGAEGAIEFTSYKGNSHLNAIKGRLEFKNGVSPIHIEKLEGELRGQSAQGAVFANIEGDADVRINSAEGAVNLHLPSSSAWVNLITTDGQMGVPGYLKPTRLPTQVVRAGKLQGGRNGGSVYVKTTSGDIHIK